MLHSTRRGPLVWAVSLTCLLLVGVFATVGMAADPEPQLQVFPASNFDPGPGWPGGWTPPQAPTSIPPERQASYDNFNSTYPPEKQTDQLLLQVLPLPEWTKEYPYVWQYSYTDCGRTTYLYYYPDVDSKLVYQLTGEVYAVTVRSGGTCGYTQIGSITKPLKPRPDEIERNRLIDQMQSDIAEARKGLTDCPDWSDNRPESIQVCFNGGDASQVFDAPAYLDTIISRVRVPVRFVSELMGAEVTWNGATRQVTIALPTSSRKIVKLESAPGFTTTDWWSPTTHTMVDEANVMKEVTISQPARTIVLTVGQPTAYVNGQPVTIDAPPVIVPAGRTMVPLRFVSEQLGADVYWIGNEPIFTGAGENRGTYQVHIYTQFHPWSEAPTWYLKKGN